MVLSKGNKPFIDRIANRNFVLLRGIVFIAAYILMNTLFLDFFMSQSNGNMFVETNIFYASTLADILQSYGEIGRECYIKLSFQYDFIFPLQYSLFFASCSILILKKYVNIKWQKAFLLIGGVLCLSEWAENILIIVAIVRFPNIGILAIAAQFMTLLKTALTVFFLIAIIIGIVVLSVNKIKKIIIMFG